MKNHPNRERGQSLILIVFAIVGLIGLTALAVDGGNAFSERRHAQNAADSTALSAALARVHEQDWMTAARNMAVSNGYGNDGVHDTVVVNNPPVAADCRPDDTPSIYVGNDEYIQVIIEANVETYFAPVVGVDSLHVCVEAIARARPPHTEPMFFGNAMVGLAPHECRAVEISGDSASVLIDGGLFVNSDSTCPSGALNQGGSSTFDAPSVCVNGAANVNDVDPLPVHCPTVLPYPPEILMPQISCATDGTRSGGVITPGNIPASWLGGDVTLEPGVYCISGSVVINAHDSLVGTDVVLYFIDGAPHINGGANLQLDAPDSGDYAGLLIYLPLDNDSEIIMNGNADSYFVGSILAPASNVQINGTGNIDSYQSQVVGYTLEIIGTADTVIQYNDNQNYDATVPPSIEIVK
ncbi:MAG: hypothetical protein JXB85_11800 [Anaerolineales bacterium]|nr:hypothetical protein [Anaerolineales bacterium]